MKKAETLTEMRTRAIQLLQDIIDEYTLHAKAYGSIGSNTYEGYAQKIRELRKAQEVLSEE